MSPLELAGLAGWIVAALVLGLWWGERGRRIDAQRERGTFHLGLPANVEQLETEEVLAEKVVQEQEIQTLTEYLMGSGVSRKKAREEAERLIFANLPHGQET